MASTVSYLAIELAPRALNLALALHYVLKRCTMAFAAENTKETMFLLVLESKDPIFEEKNLFNIFVLFSSFEIAPNLGAVGAMMGNFGAKLKAQGAN